MATLNTLATIRRIYHYLADATPKPSHFINTTTTISTTFTAMLYASTVTMIDILLNALIAGLLVASLCGSSAPW